MPRRSAELSENISAIRQPRSRIAPGQEAVAQIHPWTWTRHNRRGRFESAASLMPVFVRQEDEAIDRQSGVRQDQFRSIG